MTTATSKFWIVASGVLCALLVGEGALRVLEPYIPPPSPWPTVETQVKSAQLVTLSHEVDVVLLGSSVTEAAVDPELLGVTGKGVAYNSALPFSTPLSNEVWLDEVVLEHVSPSIVIIGVPAWPPHTTIERDPMRIGTQEALIRISNPTASGLLALVRNKGVLANWDERWVGQGLSSSDLWTDLGHMIGYYDGPTRTLSGRFQPFGVPRMSNDNLAAMIRTVKALTQAGTTVVLMIEPGEFPGEVSNADTATYLESIKDLGRDLNVPVWDTYSMGWNPDYYVDEAHFNREGTVAFTTHVAGLLVDLDIG